MSSWPRSREPSGRRPSGAGAATRATGVVAIEWNPNAEALTDSEAGQGALYDTAAFFAAEPDGALTFTMANARVRWDTTASMSRRS